MAIEHADFEGIERLAAVLGAEIVSTFDQFWGSFFLTSRLQAQVLKITSIICLYSTALSSIFLQNFVY